MIQIESVPEVLPKEWIDRAQKLSTTLLSDCIDEPVVMNEEIKPCNPDSVVVGSAVTIDVHEGDNLAVHHAIYHSSPGHVLVVSANGYRTKAVIGELMAAAAEALELNGLIIDGLIRDYHTLSQASLPVFSKGAIPEGPTKKGPGTINRVIECGNRLIQPGDFIMGDADGVIVIPREKVEETLTRAEEKRTYEENRLSEIAKGNIRPKWLT
ncbi:LOW QUALITY PROTEIN: dimethylmenaquinone methyltransferase family protein [Bacillus sp. JCM 19046]|nr:LOW QUALITY PROTEIN: dimethylmenaquinone methyltransferase family protein [Bacillus sp. JCM 19046]